MEQNNIKSIDTAGGNLVGKLTRKRRLRRLALSGEVRSGEARVDCNVS